MQPLLTQLLNLAGIEVEDYTDCGGQLILEVEARTFRNFDNFQLRCLICWHIAIS